MLAENGGRVSAPRCLVAGSYPPVPGEPAAATVAAVRRAWAAGCEVVVASPRPSAAPEVLLRLGKALGPELSRLRQVHSCGEVVLCIEPGWPFVATLSAAGKRATGRCLANALLGARRAELVISGEVAQWPPGTAASLAPLMAVVSVVTASSEEMAELARTVASVGPPARMFAGPGRSGPLVRALPPPTPALAELVGLVGGVGPLEPGELGLQTRARRLAGRLARRAFGANEPAVRARLGRLARRLAH